VAVAFQDLVDERKERAQDGFLPRRGALVGGRFLVVDDLVDGPEVEVVFLASLPEAQLTRQHAATDFRPALHVV